MIEIHSYEYLPRKSTQKLPRVIVEYRQQHNLDNFVNNTESAYGIKPLQI